MQHVHTPKNEKFAKRYRDKGNELFTSSKFCDALEFYNKSLCFAQKGSEAVALAYGNRSAVYLEIKEFELCLENIKLARGAGFPSDKLERLNERERRCIEMKTQQQQPDEDPWNFFKLSYSPNKHYPAIVDCLELQTNEKYGRHIITNRDLKTGDIVAVEEAAFKFLLPEGSYIRCANCFKSNKMSLIPFDTCADAMFCSQKCLDYGKDKNMCAVDDGFSLFERFTREALDIVNGDLSKLESLTKDLELCKKTIFDLDLSNPDDPDYKYNQLLALNSLHDTSPNHLTSIDFKAHPIMQRWSTETERNIVAEFMDRILSLSRNATELALIHLSKSGNSGLPFDLLTENSKICQLGGGICLFSSLLNHACCPNIFDTLVDNKIAFVVAEPIKKGEQLFICYGVNMVTTIEVRQEFLLNNYGFTCDCDWCKKNWNIWDFHVTDPQFKASWTYSSSQQAIDQFKRNCDYIDKNFINFPCKEIIFYMMCTPLLLDAIAKTEKFLFDKMY